MIVVTGAAGFIGSCLVNKLNNKGLKDILLVDDFNRPEKEENTTHKSYVDRVDRDRFLQWLNDHHTDVSFVCHIGARTDTTETDKQIFDRLNLHYSMDVWKACSEYSLPLIYASSAATYGLGEQGYADDHALVPDLKPLNAYGESKNEFDKWVLKQTTEPPFWAGLKFFNVYGPNEYHKARMASVIFHAYGQIRENGYVRLFRSHRPDFEDGKQLRDFIYVKDVVNVIYYLMNDRPSSGLYNLGTGQARTFLDLARATFRAMDLHEDIRFIDTPEDIREKYQYFTEADMDKLRNSGYRQQFYSLEEGVEEYVREFLIPGRYF
jgi:ADP-L-glycero-D-manno-heptose 6-epimerase